MALGLNYASSEGGEITPIVKYDARAGRWFRIDREDGVSVPHDITNQFAAVFDLEEIEVGWMHFMPGQAPDFHMAPLSQRMLPDRPSEHHKQGFRMKLKLAGPIGGDVREFASNAKCVLAAIDILHDAYKAGVAEHPGQLPVVRMTSTLAVKATKSQMSPSYQPVFEIIRWAPRPKDLVVSPAAASPPAVKAGAPATGATKMAPPAASSVPFDTEDDFG